MQLIITQKPDYEFLGGPKHKGFTVNLNGESYDIDIDQIGKRTITISTTSSNYNGTLSVFYSLETLLMLFDGHFYPVERAFDGADITASWKERSLSCYSSADFMLDSKNRLIEFDAVLDEPLFHKWLALKKELDIVHNMVLYCLSSVKMPKDMQCAFMVETFIGICELVAKMDVSFVVPSVPKRDSKLKYYFLAVAERYGADIFAEEFSRNRDTFAQILVNSRNRIAHIKSRQGRVYLNGEESVFYMMKLSLLYRVVLFDLLGIPSSKYENALLSRVQKVNDHTVIKDFLNTL